MSFLIAEVAQSHDGSLGIAHSFIDALNETGIDAIKFQIHIAEAESSIFEPFRTNFSYQDKNRFDYWKRISFSYEEWEGIKQHCNNLGIEFIASPFSILASSWLKKLKVNRVKIGSGEFNNFLLLDHISEYADEIILSTGLCSEKELFETIKFVKNKFKKIHLLQCVTEYPTVPEKWGLNFISEFKKKFKDISIGFSDHSGTIFSSLAAASLGAEMIEFHVTYDKKMFGPDSNSSLTINEVKMLSEGVKMISKSINSDHNKFEDIKKGKTKNIFAKSLALNKDLLKGEKIKKNYLETLKPGRKGISPKYFDKVVGSTLNKNLKKGDFINFNDFL